MDIRKRLRYVESTYLPILEERLQTKIPKDKRWVFIVAFVHPSLTQEDDAKEVVQKYLGPDSIDTDYERLEFLGDSALGWIVTKWIMVKYPHYKEGALTKKRSMLVDKPACVKYFHELGLPIQKDRYVLSEPQTRNESFMRNLLADLVESILGAISSVFGIDYAEWFFHTYYAKHCESLSDSIRDFISLVKQMMDAYNMPFKTYYNYVELGREPNAVQVGFVLGKNSIMGIGVQSNKKDARRLAAEQTYNNPNFQAFIQTCESVKDQLLSKRPKVPKEHGENWEDVYCKLVGTEEVENGPEIISVHSPITIPGSNEQIPMELKQARLGDVTTVGKTPYQARDAFFYIHCCRLKPEFEALPS